MQLSLALARQRDPATARAAAARVDTTALEGAVLDALRANPDGLTAHEIAECLNRSLVSVSPRMRPLVGKGKVVTVGRRDGRTVWRLT